MLTEDKLRVSREEYVKVVRGAMGEAGAIVQRVYRELAESEKERNRLQERCYGIHNS